MATILIVDDIAAQRVVLGALLREEGHTVLEAANGAAALQAVEEEHPDLVITDVLMPVMDGYELVRRLRLDPRTRLLPVIFYTAHYSQREAKALALSTGASFVLSKPVSSAEILELVMLVLSGATVENKPADELPLRQAEDQHLRLLTDRLYEKTGDLRAANARLRAVINIGLELASTRDPRRLLQALCTDARDLFGATYTTAGLVDLRSLMVRHVETCGAPMNWVREGEPAPGILGRVVVERRTMRGENPDGRASGFLLPSDHPEVRSFLAAPIAASTRVYGWICLVGNEGRSFTEDDEDLVTALAGQVGRIFEIEHEIVERKEAEVALRQERDVAQRYLDTAEVMLIELDNQGRIVLANRYACSVLGWSAGELIGKDWVDTCLPSRIREEMRLRFRELLHGAVPFFENPVITRQGTERVIAWRNTLLRDEVGGVVGNLSSGTDITERKLAEEEARALFVSNPLPMWIYEAPSLRFLAVNDAAMLSYGYSRSEFLSMTLADIRPPEDIPDLMAYVSQGRDAARDAGTWRHRTHSGELMDVSISTHPILFAEKPAVLVVAQDVTERKRAGEAALLHARLSALGVAVGVALTGPASIDDALQQCAEALITHLDAALARIWTLESGGDVLALEASAGLATPARAPHRRVGLGESPLGAIARDVVPLITNALDGDPQGGEQEWVRREGIRSFAGLPLVVNGAVVGVLAVFSRHELTQPVLAKLDSVASHIALAIGRQRGVSALRTAEERMRYALEAAGVGIWDMDYTTGKCLWSETIEAQYGLAPGTFGGTFEAFAERIHPDDRDRVLAVVGAAMKAGSDFSMQNRTLWMDGTVHWLSATGRVELGEQGQPIRAVGISMDVTASHSLEQQYQQAQKMEAVGRLAGGVAHDFNNLLTAILGYCELLLAEFDPKDPRKDDVVEIQKAGHSAAALTRQLLAFSRKQIIEPAVVDLNAVVAGMKSLLVRLIGEDVKVVLALRPGLGSILADRGQMEQIVLNLAVNARDAMPGGGVLTIETADVELDASYRTTHIEAEAGPYVVLSVADTGSGMTPEVQARLFEPFFTTKGAGKGTGLGLATVHGIVKQSHGTVNVYSEVGHGTLFKVYFPRIEGAVAVEDPVRTETPGLATHTVLLVEDADGLRELTRRLLERLGYRVLVAGNAATARQLFEENASIDVLLTDVVMPGASGPELTRQLAEQRPGLRVLYMSGYTEEAIVQHGVLNAGIAFLHKPFSSDTLGQKLREVLERAPAV